MTYKPPGAVFVPGVIPSTEDIVKTITDDPQGGLVKTWSYSTLKKFETCAYAVYLAKVAKLPIIQGDAAARGEQLHTLAENYIKGEEGTFPEQLHRQRTKLEDLREQYAEGNVYVEDEWAFTPDYEPVAWRASNAWCRMKLDAILMLGENGHIEASITDWKSGRKFGNEMSHGQQLQLYAIAAFSRYPTLEYVKAECEYIDRNEPPLVHEYTRKEALFFRPRWSIRALRLTTAVEFPPNPSMSNCRFCDFRKEGCEWSNCK